MFLAADKVNYELLCSDGSRKSVDEFKTCHLARVPADAVVSRKDRELANRISDALQELQVWVGISDITLCLTNSVEEGGFSLSLNYTYR